LQTGLSRWSKANGGWVPAAEQIERVNGSLLARQTQNQVIFGDTANAADGTIDLLMVNGARFRIRPVGIAYTEFRDGQQGRSVYITKLQSSAAVLTASNQVTYFAALEYGDFAYDLSLAGLEQNVVLRQRLPRPQDLQMDEKLVRVECWTEILESPAPVETVSAITRADGSKDEDSYLDFGPLQMRAGRAFSIGETPTVRVAKQWQKVGNSTYLIESVPYLELAPLLVKLPARQASRPVDPDQLKALWAKQVSGKRGLPLSLPEVRAAQTRMARVTTDNKTNAPGVVLDFTILGSTSNFIFKGDTTYYVSSNVFLTGTNTIIEGGTVVKFTNDLNAKIIFSGPIDCRADAYTNGRVHQQG
jgi:hypothetical protein